MNDKPTFDDLERWIDRYYQVNGTPTLDEIRGQIALMKNYKSPYGRTIEQLKKYAGYSSSEYLFGIPEQPNQMCPAFDRVERIAKDCDYNSRSIQKTDMLEEATELASDTEWKISSLLTELEGMRNEVINLRTWGQSWKDLAKELFDFSEDKPVEFLREDFIG